MRLTKIFGIALVLFSPAICFAANLSFYPSSITLHKGDSVGIYVQLQSTDEINTVGTAIDLPPNLAFLSASEGPVIGDWIEQPTFSAASSSVLLQGIIPNGWKGTGTLAVIKVAAMQDGTYSLTFDPSQTQIYKNDGNATPEPVAFGSVGVSLFNARTFTGSIIFGILLVLIYLIIRRKYRVTFV